MIFASLFFLSIASVIYANECCNNSCVKFKDSKNYCAVLTNDLDVAESATFQNATIRSKRVIEDESVDGNVIVLNGAEFTDLTVNGEVIVNGIPFVPGNTDFATFTTISADPILDDAIVPFDSIGSSSTGIVLNADGSFTLRNPGIYVINFYLLLNSNESAFAISTIPATSTSKLANTTFGRGGSDSPLNGITIIQTTLPNTTLAIQNVSNSTQNPDDFGTGLNITAAVQIFRIG